MWEQILQALQPAILLLADHLIELAVGAIAVAIYRVTGVMIDEKHMRALHSAAMTGVRVGIESGLSGDALRRVALEHVRSSVPDAVNRLTGGDQTVLGRLVQAKLQEALGRLPAHPVLRR